MLSLLIHKNRFTCASFKVLQQAQRTEAVREMGTARMSSMVALSSPPSLMGTLIWQ